MKKLAGIIVKRDKVEVYDPLGFEAKNFLENIMKKYGIKGEIKRIWCG